MIDGPFARETLNDSLLNIAKYFIANLYAILDNTSIYQPLPTSSYFVNYWLNHSVMDLQSINQSFKFNVPSQVLIVTVWFAG